MKNVPTFAGCHLATHPKSGSCGSRGIRLLIFLLFVLETSQHPSGLCPEEITLFVRLDGEHPSSGHIISRLDLPHVDEIKILVVNPGSVLQNVLLQQTVCSILVLLELMVSFRARDLLLALVPAALPQVAIQRSNMSLVRPSTPSGTSTFMLPKSSVTSLRHNDRCTHGMVVNLHMSC